MPSFLVRAIIKRNSTGWSAPQQVNACLISLKIPGFRLFSLQRRVCEKNRRLIANILVISNF